MTYNDKRAMLAAAIGVSDWRIDDVSDTEVFYTEDTEGTPGNRFKGAYRRTYKIAEGNKISLGEPTRGIRRTVFEPITVVQTFSLEGANVVFSDDDDMVILEGKVFEAGDYPDKNFSITDEELAAAVQEFKPVENDLEHEDTILDGKLGKLVSVSAKGKELFGKVELPKWLYERVGNPIKVSLAWARDTKRIVGNALVLNPRVPDAQLVAAFSAYEAERNNPANQKDGGAEMPKERKWWEKLLNLHKEKQLPEGLEDFNPEEVRFEEATPGPAGPTPGNPDQARFTALETENAGLRAAAIQTSAERFYAETLSARKCMPAEKDELISLFKQAVLDDNAGKACFSARGELQTGDRVKALRSLMEKRPAHQLLDGEHLEGIEAKDLVVLSAGGGPGGDADQPTPKGQKISDTRRAKLRKDSGIAVEGGN